MENIPGINYDKVTEQFEGNTGNFLRVLRTYASSTKVKLDLLEKLALKLFDPDCTEERKNTLKQYEITVHGIKGTSRGVCAEQLGNKAAELEKAAEAEDLDFIKEKNPALIQETRSFIDYADKMFNSIDSKIIKEKKDKPDSELLKKLIAACEIYDMMEIETAINEISKYQYDTDADLVKWLQQNAEEMNYEAIIEKLQSYLSQMVFNAG